MEVSARQLIETNQALTKHELANLGTEYKISLIATLSSMWPRVACPSSIAAHICDKDLILTVSTLELNILAWLASASVELEWV